MSRNFACGVGFVAIGLIAVLRRSAIRHSATCDEPRS